MARGFLFLVPDRCTKCNVAGGVNLAHTVTGAVVLISWSCGQCNAQWPVTPSDHVERRRHQPGRRGSSESERRKQ